MYTFKELFFEIKKYKKKLFYANLLAIFATIVGICIPLLIPLLVDEVLLKHKGVAIRSIDYLFQKTPPLYMYVVIILILTIILRLIFFILNFFQTKIFTIIAKNITYKIRKNAVKRLSSVSLSGFEFFGAGKASSLIVVDINTIDEFLGTTISRFIIAILQLICVIAILFAISWQLALFLMIINPFVVLLTTKIARKIAKLKKEQNKSFSIFQDSFSETLELFSQIRASNKDKKFLEDMKEKLRGIKNTSINFTYKNSAAQGFSFLIFMVGFEIFRAMSILVVAYSDLSIGMMMATFSYLWMLMGPIQDILGIQYAYHNAKSALDRINEIYKLPLEPKYEHKFNPFENTTTNSITLQNISFGYDNNMILKDINMQIPTGKKVAIIGASGSGKTSLAQILVGFYPFNSGDIKYDNITCKQIGLDVIRENVFLVLQNPQLLNASIKENICFGVQVSEEVLQNAIKIAQLETLIEQLPQGLQTQIGKHGVKLSGGQRQRLSIARMIVKNPNIVILDESTSALDVYTEDVLFEQLNEYLQKKTTIIIAHRLSTIKNVDYIYVIDKGRILEQGTHEQLLEKDGAFATYYMKNKG